MYVEGEGGMGVCMGEVCGVGWQVWYGDVGYGGGV